MKPFGNLLLALSALGVSGCAVLNSVDNLAPIPSQNELAPFAGRLIVPGARNPKLSVFKSELGKFIGEYHAYAIARRKLEWDSTGMTTYGGLAAVLGGLADRTGLLNTGAVLAGTGLAISSRYHFNQQSQVYFTAVKKLSCINSKVQSIPDTLVEDAMSSDDKNAADIAKQAVTQLAGSVDAVRIEATNAMLGIAPGTPSRDELLAMFKSYAAATAASAPPPGGADGLRKREAGEQVKAVLAETAACAKT